MNFPRSFRSIEFAWLLAALVVSVASLSSVAYLADRMQRAFERDAKQLIASDALIQSDQPLPILFEQEAAKQGLLVAKTTVFPTMSSVGSNARLVALKAVTESYPLRGSIKISKDDLDIKGTSARVTPSPGSVWVEPALLAGLSAKLGDRITLGSTSFVIEALLTQELDKGAGFLNFAPRVMMRDDELSKTQLIGFGSRVTYRFLIAGEESTVNTFLLWAQKEIDGKQLRGIKIEGVDNSQPLMRATLDRAEKFLSLVAILTAMVAAVAMALAAKRYTSKQANPTAIWKCLGANKRQVLLEHFKASMVIALLGGVMGAFLGWIGHQGLLFFLGDLLVADLPSASVWPLIWSLLVAVVLLIGFVWPPLLYLSDISPLKVIRRDISVRHPAAWLLMFFGLISFFVLLFSVAKDIKLAVLTLGGFTLAAGVFVLVSWALIKLTSKMAEHSWLGQHVVQRFVWQSLSRRSLFTGLQIASLAIAIMALLLLAVVRQDLMSAWKGSSPPDAPNRFLINIQPEQKAAIEQKLLNADIKKIILYPMVRGRLTHINDQVVLPQDFEDSRAQRLVDREFNLSYAADLPDKNKVTAGAWHGNTRAPEVSIEKGLAKTLSLKLGDSLVFDIAGIPVKASVTSIRELDWGSMRVNFFAILPPHLLNEMPQTWITAYKQGPLVPQVLPLDISVVAQFPNVTVVDVESALNQVQDVLNKLSAAVELLFGFTVIAGILVLAAALASTQDERLKDAGLLKTLGASQAQIKRAFYTELSVIGFIAGLMASLGAIGVGWALATHVFEFNLPIPWIVIIYGVVFGVSACILGGLWLQRKISHTSASEVLRNV
jgi:putative ABC transport system permease protein